MAWRGKNSPFSEMEKKIRSSQRIPHGNTWWVVGYDKAQSRGLCDSGNVPNRLNLTVRTATNAQASARESWAICPAVSLPIPFRKKASRFLAVRPLRCHKCQARIKPLSQTPIQFLEGLQPFRSPLPRLRHWPTVRWRSVLSLIVTQGTLSKYASS